MMRPHPTMVRYYDRATRYGGGTRMTRLTATSVNVEVYRRTGDPAATQPGPLWRETVRPVVAQSTPAPRLGFWARLRAFLNRELMLS